MAKFIVPMADEAHANGMLSNDMVVLLAPQHNVQLPVPYIAIDGQRVWTDYTSFHQAYDAGVRLIQPQDVYNVVYGFLSKAARMGCWYIDILSSGMNNFRDGNPWPLFHENMTETLRAMNDAREEGIESSLVPTLKRHLGPAKAHELVDLVIKFKQKNLDPKGDINAIHMAGDEETVLYTCEQFSPVFHRIRDELGFEKNGVHASETKMADDARQAVQLRGVSRGTHFLSAVDDPSLMEEMYNQEFMVNIPLTSNEVLHAARFPNPQSHPIRTLFNFGIPIGLGTDDPGPLNITIAGEYQKAHTKYGFSESELLLMTVNSVRYGFARSEVRQRVLNRLADFNREHGLHLPDEVFDLNRRVDLRSIVASLPKRQVRVERNFEGCIPA